MEGLGEVRGAEGGMEPEFHEIPSQGPSQTSQAEYIRAPAQGLPSTNEFSRVSDTPEKINCTNQPALTILFKMLSGMFGGIRSRNPGGDNCTSLGPNYRLGRYSSMGVRSDGK